MERVAISALKKQRPPDMISAESYPNLGRSHISASFAYDVAGRIPVRVPAVSMYSSDFRPLWRRRVGIPRPARCAPAETLRTGAKRDTKSKRNHRKQHRARAKTQDETTTANAKRGKTKRNRRSFQARAKQNKTNETNAKTTRTR